MVEVDGMEKFAFTIQTKKHELGAMTWLAGSFDEQEEWATAIASHLKHASASDGGGSPSAESSSPGGGPVDKHGWLDLEGKVAGSWAEKYASVSAVGFSWDDGESSQAGESTPQADIRLKFVAESAESYGAWIVALKWLEGGCRGRAPRDDPHMCVRTTLSMRYCKCIYCISNIVYNYCCAGILLSVAVFVLNYGSGACAGTRGESRQDL